MRRPWRWLKARATIRLAHQSKNKIEEEPGSLGSTSCVQDTEHAREAIGGSSWGKAKRGQK